MIRASVKSTTMVLIVAAGLTAYGNPESQAIYRKHIMHVADRASEWYSHARAGLRARFGTGAGGYEPGPTYALVLSGGSVVGIDRRGYSTYIGSSYTGEMAAITGLRVRCDSVGQRISAPGVSLGLMVVKAFGRFADLPDLLSEVNVANLESPKAILCGGTAVDIGTGDYRVKVRRLRQILLQAPELGIRPMRVDMRFGREVVVEYEEMRTQARKEV